MLFIYQKIVQSFSCFIVLFMMNIFIANAQTLEEEEEDWVPSMLQAKTSTYLQLMQYGGYGIGWKYRGFDNPSLLVLNGMIWDNKSLGISLSNALPVLNVLSRTTSIQSFPFITRFANINASEQAKQISFSSRFQNLIGRQLNQLQWSSGLSKKYWATILKIQEEKTFMQDPAFGKRKALGIVLSLEKVFSPNESIGFSIWYNKTDQTKQLASSEEAIQLSTNSAYNPGWGWYNGQLLFPNRRYSNLPMGQMFYSKKINEQHYLQISCALALGKQSEDGLEWASTKDPRPDYYKYLPSYYSDSLLKQKIIQFFKEHPLALQLDLDQMKKINQANKDSKSSYVINNAEDKIRLLQQAIRYRYAWSDRGQVSMHYNAMYASIEKSNTIANLLGGKYFLNHNSWVNDEGVDAFQYDINAPDKHIIEGAAWGPHFVINNIDQQIGLMANLQLAHWEYQFGMGYGIRFFQREGYNQNGLFPNASLGKSSWLKFPSNNFQWSIVYKQNPRIYYSFNAFTQQIAPSWKEAFLNISMQDRRSNFLLPLRQYGVALGFHYVGMYYRTDWNIYTYMQKNKMGNTSFYHDYYNAFVIASYGLMDNLHHGLDLSLETNFNSILNYQFALSWNSAIINNNPVYTMELLNGAYPLESGRLHIKNLPSTTSPPVFVATGLNAQVSGSFRISLNAQIAWNRYLALDYFRRSFLWEKKLKEYVSSESTLPMYQIPTGLMANIFCSKSFQFQSIRYRHRIITNFQLNNVFNTILPVFAFEQSRFDYKHFKVDKFVPKYIMGRPFSGAVQFIYQIN